MLGDAKPLEEGVPFVLNKCRFRLPEMGQSTAADAKKNFEEQLAYQKSFLVAVEKKLANKQFVEKAPKALVARERKKKEDAKERIAALEQALAKV